LKTLFDAIMTKFTAAPGGVNNAFFVDISGRLFFYSAPDDEPFPKAVFRVVSVAPERTFTEMFTNALLQLSLFSSDLSGIEIEKMLTDSTALYDECSLSISDHTLVWMKYENLAIMEDEIITDLGTQKILHYAIDYDVKISLN